MTPDSFRRAQRLLPPAPYQFPYGKGDFALQLLHRQVAGGASARVLKASRYNALMHQRSVQRAMTGRGILDQTDCQTALKRGNKHIFPISWRSWGSTHRYSWRRRYHQMARPGLNLVVQLNLPRDHLRDFRALCSPKERDPFNYSFHPVRRDGDVTLAWARLDLDLQSREALIEELQSDWILNAQQDYAWGLLEDRNFAAPKHRSLRYFEYALKPLQRLWPEALMSACLHILLDFLRMKHVYLYDYATGCGVKMGDTREPVGPISLYENLPRTFCMEKRACVPDFLQEAFSDDDVTHAFYEEIPHFWTLQSRGSIISPRLRRAA